MFKLFKDANTFRYLVLLIAVFMIGILSLIVLHLFFLDLMGKLDSKTQNLSSKIKIAEYIVEDIRKIRTDYFELSAATNNTPGVDIVIERIFIQIKNVEKSLNILERGGVLDRVIALNMAGHLSTKKSIKYEIDSEDYFSIEAIDVKPKLKELVSMTMEVRELLVLRNKFLKRKNSELYKIARKIKRLNKAAPAFFNRMIENMNRLLYEGENELNKLEKQIEDRKNYYQIMELVLILVIIFVVLFLGQIIAKEILNLNDRLQEQLYIDSLTKLENRFALQRDLALKRKVILVLIDIDDFKSINDVYGVSVGNKVLIQFANFLKTFAYKNSCKVYRISADEYVLLKEATSFKAKICKRDLEELIYKVRDKKLYIEEIDDFLEIDLSIGVAFESKNPLIKADMALNKAKTSDKQIVFYNPEIDYTKELQDNLYWKKELKSALLEDRVIPVFQPIYNRFNKIVKYEALMRIQKCDEDNKSFLITPAFFLDIAVKTKLYRKLSQKIIEEALNFIIDKEKFISINLNYQDIASLDFHNRLKNFLREFHIGKYIIFEITESENIEDYKLLKDFIKEFRNYDIKFAIDDFGSGFSNFSHILEIAPDFIKIDGSLIRNIDSDKKSFELVKAVSHFAKELNIKTIAEYVHSQKVYDITYNLGIDEFQGFYLGKPLESI